MELSGAPRPNANSSGQPTPLETTPRRQDMKPKPVLGTELRVCLKFESHGPF